MRPKLEHVSEKWLESINYDLGTSVEVASRIMYLDPYGPPDQIGGFGRHA